MRGGARRAPALRVHVGSIGRRPRMRGRRSRRQHEDFARNIRGEISALPECEMAAPRCGHVFFISLEPPPGLEPGTYCLRCSRSTNRANVAYAQHITFWAYAPSCGLPAFFYLSARPCAD